MTAAQSARILRQKKKENKYQLEAKQFVTNQHFYQFYSLSLSEDRQTFHSLIHAYMYTRMLEIQQYKRKTHGFRTFSCFGPHIWNSLPQDLRHCLTLSSFKAKLKTFLFSQYFHPN